MKKILLLCCVMCYALVSAQQTKKSALYKELSGRIHDTVFIKTHNSLGDLFSNESADSALYHYHLALKKAFQISNDKFIAVNCYEIGVCHSHYGAIDSSIAYYSRGVKYAENFKPAYISLMSGLGYAWSYKGNYLKAYEYFLKYLAEAERSGTTLQQARACTNIGTMLKEQKKFDEAISYFRRAVGLYEKNSDNTGAHIANVNMASTFYEKGAAENNDSLKILALEYFNRARPLTEIKDDYNMRSASITLLSNIANVYTDLKKYDEAIKEYENATALIEGDEFANEAALVYNNLAELYIILKDIPRTREALKYAEDHTRKSDGLDRYEHLYHVFSKYYSLTGDYKKALEYYQLHKQYSDSLLNTDIVERRKEYEMNYEFDKKEAVARAEQEKKEAIATQEKKQQRLILYSVISGLGLTLLLTFFIYKGYRNKKKANEIITEQKKEVEKSKEIIEKQKELVEEKQKEILDSIHYAKRIQDALMGGSVLLEKSLAGNYFVYFQPKDIVSGDFYWATEHNGFLFLAVCDSTGHGVPGAFMSLLNIGFLTEAISEQNITEPNLVFDYVRGRLISSISKEGQKDGFDGILFRLNKSTGEICYAAAHNKPLIVMNGEYKELPCDKMPVGKGEKTEPFTLHHITDKNATLYLFTDGFADQFGGEKGKKFKYKPMYELFASASEKDPESQKQNLNAVFHSWKKDLEQVDDVLVMGIKI